MNQDEFINTLKKLYFIDRSTLPELTKDDWIKFSFDPARYLISAHIVQQTAIMEELNREY